jgi:hypothetical protein
VIRLAAQDFQGTYKRPTSLWGHANHDIGMSCYVHSFTVYFEGAQKIFLKGQSNLFTVIAWESTTRMFTTSLTTGTSMDACLSNPYATIDAVNRDHTSIEMEENEKLIIQVALQRFPEQSAHLQEQITMLHKQITVLKAERSSIESGCAYSVYKYKGPVYAITMLAGLLLGSSLLFNFIYKSQQLRIDSPDLHTFLAVIVSFGAVTSFIAPPVGTLCLSSRVKGNIDENENRLAALDLDKNRIHQIASQLEILATNDWYIQAFCHQWHAFVQNPQTERLKELFVALQRISNKDVRVLFADRSSFLSPEDNLSLILMNDVTNVLKQGPIVDAWQKLLKAPSEDAEWGNPEAEPWKSLEVSNPSALCYANYFKLRRTRALTSLAELIWQSYQRLQPSALQALMAGNS